MRSSTTHSQSNFDRGHNTVFVISLAFMMAFNGDREFDTHAAVGTQVTFNGQQTAQDEDTLAALIALANDGAIGLIAHGTATREGTVRRGWVYRPASGRFQASASRTPERTLGRLRRLSNNNGFVWTFTAVPAGTETRMGIDRDDDGILDEDDADIPGVQAALADETPEKTANLVTRGGGAISVVPFLLLVIGRRAFRRGTRPLVYWNI